MGAAQCCECTSGRPPGQDAVAAAPVMPSTKGKNFSREELGERFDAVDLDGNGDLDIQEFAVLLEGMKLKFSAKKLENFFKAIDADSGGSISREEFIDFFAGVPRKTGFGNLIQQKLQENEEKRSAKKKPGDVFIVHGMDAEAGRRRAMWLAEVLEFTDLTCSGDFCVVTRPSSKGSSASIAPMATVLSVERCECACLLLDGLQPVLPEAAEQVRAAGKAGLKVCCLFEAGPDTWRNLAPWKEALPEAFQRPAIAISPSHFLLDSEQLALDAIFPMLNRPTPFLGSMRPPGGDEGDFSKLSKGCVKWLKAEYVLALKAGMVADDLPLDVFEEASDLRPCYVSYAQLDPSEKALSHGQKACLKIAMKRNALQGQERGDRIFFLNQVSLEGCLLRRKEVNEFSEMLSMARFVVIDEVDSFAKDPRPYLSRGSCVLELMVALLTGLMAPCREGQLHELDDAIGGELQEGMSLRKFFRENSSDPRALLEALSSVLLRREFASQEERDAAPVLLRKVLQRHPMLVPGQEKRPAHKKPGDVFIIHGMGAVAGYERAWWLAGVVEFRSDLKCAGDFCAPKSRMSLCGSTPAAEALSVEQCECACLLLDGLQPVSQRAKEQVKAAKSAGLKVCCFYEAETDTWRNLAPWKTVLPEAFEWPAVAISPSHYLSDSEQLVLDAVYAMLDRPSPFLGSVRPPGGDEGAFSKLCLGEVRWLKAEYVLSIKAGMAAEDLPLDVFEDPHKLRPCFISHAQLDPAVKGLSQCQKARLKIALSLNALAGQGSDRVFLSSQVSLEGCLLLHRDLDGVAELLSMARFLVIDEVDAGAKDSRPYLARGSCVLEVMIALLTGLVAPCREGQFRELDLAIGSELQGGTGFRKFFREQSSDPRALLEALSSLLLRKDFASQDERDAAHIILTKVLQKHPMLVAGPNSAVASDHRRRSL